MNLNDFIHLAKLGLVSLDSDQKGALAEAGMGEALERLALESANPDAAHHQELADRVDMTPRELRESALRIVLAFLDKNEIAREELGALVRETLHALSTPITYLADRGLQEAFSAGDAPANLGRPPAIESESYVVCLEDGKKLRSLRRHLWEKHGLTVDDYRKKWGLPADYPLVASELSEKRSQFARQKGFGQVRTKARGAKRT